MGLSGEYGGVELLKPLCDCTRCVFGSRSPHPTPNWLLHLPPSLTVAFQECGEGVILVLILAGVWQMNGE